MLTERTYFLVLPTVDLEGVLPLAANYSDASGMSRALQARLEGSQCRPEGSGTSLLEKALGFWTEHSQRHNMPYWVGALMQVPEEGFNHLGGWAQKGAAARYVETAERRIMSMQETVAKRRREHRGAEDLVDEGKLWHSL